MEWIKRCNVIDCEFALHKEQLIEQFIQTCRENNFHFLLTKSLLVFGEWCIQQGRYAQAVPFCLEAKEIAKNYMFEELTSRSMSSLCTCFDALQDERNFLKYAKMLYRFDRGGNGYVF